MLSRPYFGDCFLWRQRALRPLKYPALWRGLTGPRGRVTMIIRRISPLSNLFHATHTLSDHVVPLSRVSAAAVPWPIDPLPAKGPPVRTGLEALAAHSLCGRLRVLRAVVMVKHHSRVSTR
jgi:hypothetical protein